MLLIPYVLITSGGYSPVQAGLAMLPLPILMTSISPTMGSLAARIGPAHPADRSARSSSPSGMLLARADRRRTAAIGPARFPTILVMALGMTIAVAPLTSSVLGSVEEQHVAMASGFNSAVARTGGLIATALLGAVLASEGDAAVRAASTCAMFVSAVVAALAERWSR